MLWFFVFLLPSTLVERSTALCGLPGYFTSLQYTDYFKSLSSMFVFKEGQEVEYVCKNGLFMIGNSTRVCLGRTWSGDFPSCGKVLCVNLKSFNSLHFTLIIFYLQL